MDHCAEHFSFLSDNHFAKISLINILLRIMEISILKQDCFCAGFHQILINKKSDSLRIHQNDLILCTCDRNRIRTRHVIKLALCHSASAAGESLTGHFFPVSV